MDNQQGPTVWNSAQCYVAAWMEGEFGEEWIHVLCMAESLRCSLETNTTLLVGYTPKQNKKLKKEKQAGASTKQGLLRRLLRSKERETLVREQKQGQYPSRSSAEKIIEVVSESHLRELQEEQGPQRQPPRVPNVTLTQHPTRSRQSARSIKVRQVLFLWVLLTMQTHLAISAPLSMRCFKNMLKFT